VPLSCISRRPALNPFLPNRLATAGRQLAGALCLGLFLAGGALAETCFYGNDNGTRATIQPHDEAFAEIVIDNRLAHRARPVCDLTIFGVTVSLEYAAGSGALPDWFIATVPPGFTADPAQVLIDDNDTGSILIWHDAGAGA
jgi:hypothetical protein